MPRYNYICDAHGEFTDWRSMREAAAPAPCPSCGDPALRAMALPSLALMNGADRKAHHINERSADQPRVEKRIAGGERTDGHGHGGHGHGHGHAHGQRPGHRHGPSRPWMIGH